MHRFCWENVSAVLQRWAPGNGKHFVLIVFSLIRPKELNVTQLIAVTFATVTLSPGFRSRWPKITRGGTFFKYNIDCMQKRPRKKVACDMETSFTSTQKGIQIWTPNWPSTVISSFGTWAREETRKSIFCKSSKLLSPCRLLSRFTFAPTSSFMSHKLQHIRWSSI